MVEKRPERQPYRALYWGTRHGVAAGHYLAAQAAFQILEAGGNAVDAGVGGGIALGVVESLMTGLAGVAPILIYLADRDEVVTVSGVGTWPKAATCEFFHKYHGGRIEGILSTAVPAAADAWITSLERFGTMSFGDVAAPAIRYARDGFVMYSMMAEDISGLTEQFSKDPATAAIYLSGGRPPGVGEVFVQKDLGSTLQYLADEEAAARKRGRATGLGAVRHAFYRGDIAAAIAKHQKENGGLITAEDLAGFRVGVEPPCRTRFAGTDVYSVGPWGQGPAMLETLNILSGFDLRDMGHNTVDYIHVVIEAIKLAMADCHAYFGDPRFVAVPIETLLSAAYAQMRRKMLRRDLAWPEMPPPGELTGAQWPSAIDMAAGVRGSIKRPTTVRDEIERPMASEHTSYICVVDMHGNAFSATPSDGIRAAPVVPGTGISPSFRGVGGRTDPNHPYSVAPGKRPRMTNGPALAMRGKRWLMPFGTPGSDNQLQAMLQVFLNVFLFGMDPQEAVEAPRFNTHSFPQTLVPTPPHDYQPGSLSLEERIDKEIAEALTRIGHKVDWWPAWGPKIGHPDMATVCAVLADRKNGVLMAAHDPRRVSGAVAV